MAQVARSRHAAANRALGLKRKFARSSQADGRLGTPSRRKKKHGGGGGPARAFISAQIRQRGLSFKSDIKMLHAEYRALSNEQKAHWKEVGSRATARWRAGVKHGVNSLGLFRHKRQAVALAEARRRSALWNRVAQCTDSERLDFVADSLVPQYTSEDSYVSALSRARVFSRFDALQLRRKQEGREAALVQWRAREGGAAAQSLTAALGLPPDRAAVVAERLVLEPASHSTVLRMMPSADKVAEELASVLHSDQTFHKLREAMEEDQSLVSFVLIVHRTGS